MTMRRFALTRPIEVAASRDEPLSLRWRGRSERVIAVEASWDVEEGWWRAGSLLAGGEATRRRYYRLRAASGLLCIIYRDLGSGRWFLEQVSD